MRRFQLVLAVLTLAGVFFGSEPVSGEVSSEAPQATSGSQQESSGSSQRVKPRFRKPRHGPVHASWYGPGLYGNHLGCSKFGRLRRGGMGVAHKSMPCGTRLRMCYKRRCTRVVVNDRGPYIRGRTLDLQEGVKRKLRFPSLGNVRYERAKKR